MSIPVLPFLQTLPTNAVVYTGALVRGRTFSSFADCVNSHVACRFLAMAHSQVERDLTISEGPPGLVAQDDVLNASMTADTHSVWWRTSAVGAAIWVGFSHAALNTDSVKDSGASDVEPGVIIKLYTEAGTLRGTTEIAGHALFKVSPSTRGLSNYQVFGEQLGLYGNIGYAHTGWGAGLLDVSADQGDQVYITLECNGVRLYSVDVVEAFLGSA